MSDFKFELNTSGVRELLLSSEVADYISSEAASRAASLGEGYTHDIYHGTNRVNARIIAESESAIQDNLENNTLLRSIS